jgi:hypothetical protein
MPTHVFVTRAQVTTHIKGKGKDDWWRAGWCEAHHQLEALWEERVQEAFRKGHNKGKMFGLHHNTQWAEVWEEAWLSGFGKGKRRCETAEARGFDNGFMAGMEHANVLWRGRLGKGKGGGGKGDKGGKGSRSRSRSPTHSRGPLTEG